jgi:hypothetical protein
VEGAVEHTDPSLFTVLAQDDIGGLQVRINGGDNDGRWVDVPPVPGALLVNVGDVLKVNAHGQNYSPSLLCNVEVPNYFLPWKNNYSLYRTMSSIAWTTG